MANDAVQFLSPDAVQPNLKRLLCLQRAERRGAERVGRAAEEEAGGQYGEQLMKILGHMT